MKSQAERAEYREKFVGIDFRKHPEKYRIGRGEEGVLLVEPYKSEILPHWKFKTPDVAEASAKTIYQMFLDYLAADDFVGADMARKFLQMGFTRAMRYSNHSSGRKYAGKVPDDKKGISGAHGRTELPKDFNAEKYKSAMIFKKYYQQALASKIYQKLKENHLEKYEKR